jgi:hypothetical protein
VACRRINRGIGNDGAIKNRNHYLSDSAGSRREAAGVFKVSPRQVRNLITGG